LLGQVRGHRGQYWHSVQTKRATALSRGGLIVIASRSTAQSLLALGGVVLSRACSARCIPAFNVSAARRCSTRFRAFTACATARRETRRLVVVARTSHQRATGAHNVARLTAFLIHPPAPVVGGAPSRKKRPSHIDSECFCTECHARLATHTATSTSPRAPLRVVERP